MENQRIIHDQVKKYFCTHTECKLFLHFACCDIRISQHFGRIKSVTRTERAEGSKDDR